VTRNSLIAFYLFECTHGLLHFRAHRFGVKRLKHGQVHFVVAVSISFEAEIALTARAVQRCTLACTVTAPMLALGRQQPRQVNMHRLGCSCTSSEAGTPVLWRSLAASRK
jgi:hypothetical protein